MQSPYLLFFRLIFFLNLNSQVSTVNSDCDCKIESINVCFLVDQSVSASVNGFTTSSSQLAPPLTVYDANSIRIVFEFEHSNDPLDLSFSSSVPPCVQIRASSYNTGSLPIESFEMQVAVPKSFQLEMFPPSATCLLPTTSDIPPVTQVFKVSNPNRVSSSSQA